MVTVCMTRVLEIHPAIPATTARYSTTALAFTSPKSHFTGLAEDNAAENIARVNAAEAGAVLSTDEDRELHARRGAREPGSGRRQRSPHRQARGSNLASEQEGPRQGRASVRTISVAGWPGAITSSSTNRPLIEPAGPSRTSQGRVSLRGLRS